DLHRDRAVSSGRPFGPGISDLRSGVASAHVARNFGPMGPVARAFGGAALRIRGDHARRHLGVVARLRRPGARVVARRTRDSVLASHRARAAPGTGDCGAQSVWDDGADEYRPALDPPR